MRSDPDKLRAAAEYVRNGGTAKGAARRFRVGLGVVYRAMRRHGVTPPNWRRDWSSVDWSLGDTEIARAMGCTHSAVEKNQRRRRGMPKGRRTPRPRKPKPPAAVIVPGVTRCRVFPWALADWRLGNTDLAGAWGCTPQCVATRRYARGKPAAMWLRDRRGRVTGDGPEYRKAIAAERRKAKAWRASG